MTRLERLAVWALLTLGLCGCTRTVETRSESALRADVATRAEAATSTTETVTSGPETITTTTEEYEVGAAPISGPPLLSASETAGDAGSSTARAVPLPPRAALIKRTVVVDQRGPVVDTRHEVGTASRTATATLVATAKTTRAERTSYWPPWWLWLAGAVLVLGIVGAVKAGLKMPFGL